MNQQIIKCFQLLINDVSKEIDELKTKGENTKSLSFKLNNFKKVSKIIEKYNEVITNGEQLKDIKGVGTGTIKRINEILNTGTLKEIKSLQVDNDIKIINDLQKITGIGPVKAKSLYKDGVTLPIILDTYKNNIDDQLFNKFTHHQILGIKYFDDVQSRIPYQEIEQIETYIKNKCQQIDPKLNITICGSYRRKKTTSGDIDILITHENIINKDEIDNYNYLIDLIEILKNEKFLVDDLTVKGTTKYMGFCKLGNNYSRRIDIRMVAIESYPASLLYFTGSGEFNKNMRTYALKNKYTINEYGIYKLNKDKSKGQKMEITSEEDIFKILKINYIEPDKRTSDIKF